MKTKIGQMPRVSGSGQSGNIYVAGNVEAVLNLSEQIAERLGIRPAQWRISSGHKVLGSCSSNRVIRLSYLLVFLPLELRQYIICHELAHLTEMNHSPRFHELCNAYCNGNERELAARLKSFNWPILR